MDELLVRGAIIGVVFAAIGFIAHYIWKLIRSPSEGARRLRIVVYSLGGLGVMALVAADYGIGGVLITAAVIGVGVWIKRGFKSNN